MFWFNKSHNEILYNSIINLHRYVLPVFYILGNIGNLLTALIFTRKSWRKNVCVFYLSTCIFFNTWYINIVLLGDILTGFDIEPYNSNSVLCKLYNYVVSLFFIFLPSVLILASIDRLLISSRNIDARFYSSKRLAYFSISLNTLFWFIFYIHILIKVDIEEKHPTIFVCYFNLSPFYLHFVSYSSLIINCFLSFTMIILCMFAFKNVQYIRSIPHKNRQQIRIMTKKDFQLIHCLFIHDIIYIIFTIGSNIFIVYETATLHEIRTPLKQSIIDFIHHFNEFLHHIPYCASFYIYIIVSKTFRNASKRMIYQIFHKDLTTIQEEVHAGRDHIELDVVIVNPIM